MPLFVKQEVLDAAERQMADLTNALDKAKGELASVQGILHETDKRFEALTQLQAAKDVKFEELKKLAKRYEEDSAKAAAALELQTTKALENFAAQTAQYAARLAALASEKTREVQALTVNLSGLQNDLDAEIAANKTLRQLVSDLRQDLSRVQTERDTLEANQRHVRLDCESQVRAIETASQARIAILEAELHGLKRKV